MPTAVDDSRLGQDRVDQADHREVARHLVDDAFVRRWCQLFEPIHISLTAHLPRRVFLVRKHCFGIIQLDAVVAEQDIVEDTGHELELSSAEDIGERRKNLLNQRDRKSVGWGKSVSVRVDPGGRRIIKKNKKYENTIVTSEK